MDGLLSALPDPASKVGAILYNWMPLAIAVLLWLVAKGRVGILVPRRTVLRARLATLAAIEQRPELGAAYMLKEVVVGLLALAAAAWLYADAAIAGDTLLRAAFFIGGGAALGLGIAWLLSALGWPKMLADPAGARRGVEAELGRLSRSGKPHPQP